MCGFENEISEVRNLVEQMNSLVHLKEEGRITQFDYIQQFLSLKEKASGITSELVRMQAGTKRGF